MNPEEWREYAVRLALDAWDRASRDEGGAPTRESFAKHAHERMAQLGGAVGLEIELARQDARLHTPDR